ncbi:MAG: hypothetical protein K2W85_11155 [Phycisphaerales bacterium]|nr:hypothetical protein [Phycisphaerales bacterium]
MRSFPPVGSPSSPASGGTGVPPVCLGILLSLLTFSTALAVIPSYTPAGFFSIPSASLAYDAQPDGRLIGVNSAGQILRQDALNASTFSVIGTLPAGTVPSFGAGFAKLSPSGNQLAVSDNGVAGLISVFSLASLSIAPPTLVTTITSFNYQAEWADEDTLYVSGAPSFGVPTSLYRAKVSTGTSTQVVNQIGDGAGGVTISAGNVYTAIGFDIPDFRNGEIRGFALSMLSTASAAVPFISGQLAGQLNTAATLDVDALGNIIVAGAGSVALLDPATGSTFTLPGLSPTGFYSAVYSANTSEILVQDFGSTTVLRYAIPTPAAFALLVPIGLSSIRRSVRPSIRGSGASPGTANA